MLTEDFDFHRLANGLTCLSLFALTRESERALMELEFDCISVSTAIDSYSQLSRFADRIRGLWCPPPEIPLHGIENLQKLERIHLNVGAGWKHVDYRALPNLHTFTCHSATGLKSAYVNHPSLRNLEVMGFPKLSTLQELESTRDLESLIVRGAPIRTLEGLERFDKLTELRMAHCRSLENTDALSRTQALQILECVGNLKAHDYAALETLRELRWVFVHSKTARQTSYAFLTQLPKLQYADVLVRTENIDLAPIACHSELVEASFFTNGDYKFPSLNEIKLQLAAKGRTVKTVQTYPNGEVPSFRVSFEPNSPSGTRPSSHRRYFVE